MRSEIAAEALSQCLQQAGLNCVVIFDQQGQPAQLLGASFVCEKCEDGLSGFLVACGLDADWSGVANCVLDGRTLLISLVRHRDGATAYVQDVSAERSLETELREQAETDPLTGLLNRRGFHRQLQSAALRPMADQTGFVLGFVDVDDLKSVNDRQGYPAGDALLRSVGGQLAQAFRAGDLTARIGGDEFCFCLVGVPRDLAQVIVQRIVDLVALTTGGSISVGATFTLHLDRLDDRFTEVASLARQAKENGKNQLVFA